MSDSQRIALLIGILLVLVFVWLRWDPNTSDHPALGLVSGKVTLDGKPLAGAIIAFYPDNGRMGTAIIDKDGNYDMKYTEGVSGTKLGPSTVHFAWQTGESGPAIPEQYGDRSTLKVDVQEKKNVFNFELESKPPEESSGSAQKKDKANASPRRSRKAARPVLD